MSLLTKLGLNAPKVVAGAALETVGAPTRDLEPGAVEQSGGPDTAMLDNATTYSHALAAAQKALASLGNDPALADAKAKIQADLIDTARGLAKAGGYKGAASLLGQVAGRVAAALAKAGGDYEKARAAVQKRIDVLEAHPLKAKVTARINAAKTKMAAAQSRADKLEFDAAGKLVAEAEPICVEAQAAADKHAAYAVKRGDAMALIESFRGLLKDDALAALTAKVTQADAKVAAATPDFPAADTLIESVRTELGDKVKAWYVTSTRAKIAALKAKPTASYVADDLKKIEAIQAQIDGHVGARAWTKAVLSGKHLGRLLSPAGKLVDRRADYEAQRSKTDAALAPLKGKPGATGVLAALMKRYKAAETLASRAQVHPEQGAAEMARIEAECPAALQAADASADYAKDRAAADTQLAALEKHVAADKVYKALGAVRKQLADATSLAAAAVQGAALANWTAAHTQVTQALADLAAAKTLADAIGPAAQAEADAVSAKDAPSLEKAIASLRASGDAALNAPFADRADKAFKAYGTAVSQAEAAGAEGDLKAAGINLGKAARHLAEAQTIQGEHGHYEPIAKAVGERLEALQAASAPMPTSIKAKIDALVKAIAQADAKDKAHDGTAALAAMRAAADVAAAAELARKEREAFDAHLETVHTIVEALVDADAKKRHRAALAIAVEDANAFAFADARHVLKVTQGRIAAEKIKGLAKANPNDPAIATTVQEIMTSGGGGAQVDELIKNLPPDTDKKVVVAIAKERFGVEFKASDASSMADMQRICDVLAKVPKDVVKNPSLKLVRHEDPDKNGGAYGTVGGIVTMNSRPGQSYQQFGANQKNSDGTDQLTGVESDCQPENVDAVDYMDFATLHEVGHSVDDANMFMASREGVAEFGGWKRYGGNLEPIADAVSKHYKYDRNYVLQKLQRLPAVAPPAPTGTAANEWSDRQRLVDNWYKIATAKNAWWRQSSCDTITIGTEKVIFHEAYAQDWVSYLAAARKKGLTGYQFRAPGEWFAELYAGFHSGKLKKTHPSAKWLSKLSV